MKNFKQTVLLSFFASYLAFSVNCSASSYIEDAKQYMEKGKYQAAIIQLKNQLKKTPDDVQARLLLGNAYLKKGDVKQADKEITRAYQIDSANEDVILVYAQLLLLQNKYEKVEEILKAEFINYDNEYQKQTYIGFVYLENNRLADAKQLFSELLKQKKSVQVFNGLAKIAILENEIDVASQWLDKSIELDPQDVNALQIKAKIANYNKDYATAGEIYSQLIEIQPDILNLYLERSKVYLSLNNYKDAENDIQHVLKAVKNHPTANFLLAGIKLKENKYKEAQMAAENVLNYIPNHVRATLILGISHFAQGNLNQADKYLTQYLSNKPDDINVQTLLANVYLGQRKGEQAVLILEGIDEDEIKKNVKALMALGSAYILTGDSSKGIKLLNQAQTLAPDNPDIKKRLINSQYGSGDVAQVTKKLEEYLATGQKNKQANYLLVVSYLQLKEIKKAEDKTKQLLLDTPDDPGLYNLMAVIQKLKENEKLAISMYNKALSIDNNYIPAFLGLTQIALENDNLDKARDYLTQVLLIDVKYINAYISLAVIEKRAGRLEGVEKYLLLALEKSEQNKAYQIKISKLLGYYYIENKMPEKVLSVANALNREYADDASILSFLAGAQILNKKNQLAEVTLKKIIYNQPENIKYRILLADLIAKDKLRQQDVIELFDEMIAIKPEDTKYLVTKYIYLTNNQLYSEALDVAGQVIKTFPDRNLGYKLTGNVFIAQKNYDKALDAYMAAYRISPNNKLLAVIIDIMTIQGKNQEIIVLLKDELKKNARNIGLLFKLANFYQDRNAYEEAVFYYKAMLELQKDNVMALNNIAWIYSLQNSDEALDYAKKAYELTPESASIADTYGYILLKQGNVDESIRVLMHAAQLASNELDIQFHLAKAYITKGNIEKGIEILTKLENTEKLFTEKANATLLLKEISTKQ